MFLILATPKVRVYSCDRKTMKITEKNLVCLQKKKISVRTRTEVRSLRTRSFSRNVATAVGKIVRRLGQRQRINKGLLDCCTRAFVKHPISSSVLSWCRPRHAATPSQPRRARTHADTHETRKLHKSFLSRQLSRILSIALRNFRPLALSLVRPLARVPQSFFDRTSFFPMLGRECKEVGCHENLVTEVTSYR
ncbi:unnamed protein product [Ixodes pacificus]